MSVYRVDRRMVRSNFSTRPKAAARAALAMLAPGDDFNVTGPLGHGFTLSRAGRTSSVLGRGVGLATLAPLSQLAAEHGVGVTAILSARHAAWLMSRDLFENLGASHHHRADFGRQQRRRERRANHRAADRGGQGRRLLHLRLQPASEADAAAWQTHAIPGQVAMEQIMVCGFGACYVCMRTFEIDGKRVLKRVCRDGPVFNMREAVGW